MTPTRYPPGKYDARVLFLLRYAAERRRQIPTQRTLAAQVGCPSTGTSRMTSVMHRLAREGRIALELEDNQIVRVTIAETGDATAYTKRLPPTAGRDSRRGASLMSASAQGAKRGGGNMQTIRRYPTAASAPRTCQYIAGEPSASDSCKCGVPCIDGSPYCHSHHAICYRGFTPAERLVA